MKPCKCQDGDWDSTVVPVVGWWPLQSMRFLLAVPSSHLLEGCLWGTASIILSADKLQQQEQFQQSGLSLVCSSMLLPA